LVNGNKKKKSFLQLSERPFAFGGSELEQLTRPFEENKVDK